MKNKIYDHEVSLAQVLGKKIEGVAGYVTNEMGDDFLIFQVTRILFADGTCEYMEGSHDMPYISNTSKLQKKFEKFFKPEEES